MEKPQEVPSTGENALLGQEGQIVEEANIDSFGSVVVESLSDP